MAGTGFASGISSQLEEFAAWRECLGVWNPEAAYDLRLFDRHCAGLRVTELTQEALDSWCARRPTETAASCASRTSIARQFATWARARGLSSVAVPAPPRIRGGGRIPHGFADEELRRFFRECDSIEERGAHPDSAVRRLICPALFRLLYSSGIRTTEARRLRRADVDLDQGVLNIRHSKGPDQHYVALHPSMVEVLRGYDAAAERLRPGREYFFESFRGGPLSAAWLSRNFREIWRRSNGDSSGVHAYDLRHEYATRNIMSWDCDPFGQHDRLLELSRSMGHRRVSFTLHYFSIVPALADKLLRQTGEGMDAMLPDVWEGVGEDGR